MDTNKVLSYISLIEKYVEAHNRSDIASDEICQNLDKELNIAYKNLSVEERNSIGKYIQWDNTDTRMGIRKLY